MTPIYQRIREVFLGFVHLNSKDKFAILFFVLLNVFCIDDSKPAKTIHCKTTEDCPSHHYCAIVIGLEPYFCGMECDPTLDIEKDCKDDPDCLICREGWICNEYGKCIKKDEVMPCEKDEDCPFDYPVCASFKNCFKCLEYYTPCPEGKVCNSEGYCIEEDKYRPCEDDTDCPEEYPVCTYYKNCEKE